MSFTSYVSGNATIANTTEKRDEALKVLRKVKEKRKGKKFILVKVDNKTYKEVELNPEPKKSTHKRKKSKKNGRVKN